MNLRTYYRSLDMAARKRFAERAGTTTQYLEVHLIGRRGPDRKPSLKLTHGLVSASDGALSYTDVLHDFYPSGKRAA